MASEKDKIIRGNKKRGKRDSIRTELDVAIEGKKHIITFNVSVNDAFRMQMSESF